jgi:hypothetical protein
MAALIKAKPNSQKKNLSIKHIEVPPETTMRIPTKVKGSALQFRLRASGSFHEIFPRFDGGARADPLDLDLILWRVGLVSTIL